MLTFEMTHTHETLGRLKIGFSVNERGEFALDFIDIRWKWQPMNASFHFWTVYFWRTDEGRWKDNYWSSRWSNGLPAHTAAHPEEHMTFLPALLDFANSPEFAALVGRRLKHNMGLMNAAMLDAAAKAQRARQNSTVGREVVLPSGS